MPQFTAQSTLTAATGLPPHAGMPLHMFGSEINNATRVVVLIHGRGAGAAGIASLATEFGLPNVTYIVPEASGKVWYPFSFLSPVAANEPGLSSGLSVIDGIITECGRRDIPPERIALAGFSQGACLALEFAIRYPKRYAAIIGFSGGLIGPQGTQWRSRPAFDGTPVFLGCSDRDMHIPAERVKESAETFAAYGAQVDMRLYANMPHTINDEEVRIARQMLAEEERKTS